MTVKTVSPHRPLRGGALALGAAALLAGPVACVSSGTHKEVVAEREGLAQRNAALEEKLAELETSSEQLAAELSAKEAKLAEMRSTYDGLVKDLKSELASGQVQIEQLRDGIRVNLAQEILFPSGSAQLDGGGQEVLAKVANQMKATPHRIEIEGHTDDVPIRSTLAQRYPTNWELAAARASRVVRLFEEQGVDGSRLRVVSRGPYAPVAPNDSTENREKNRRIEVKLLPVDAEIAAEETAPPVASQKPL